MFENIFLAQKHTHINIRIWGVSPLFNDKTTVKRVLIAVYSMPRVFETILVRQLWLCFVFLLLFVVVVYDVCCCFVVVVVCLFVCFVKQMSQITII